MNRTPRSPPHMASTVIWRSVVSKPQRKRAGSVKITPLATELEAEPTVWDRFASRMVLSTPLARSARKKATVITATGIDVEMVSPARRPRYALAAPNRIPKRIPTRMALSVASGSVSPEGTYGDGMAPPPGGDNASGRSGSSVDGIGPGIVQRQHAHGR